MPLNPVSPADSRYEALIRVSRAISVHRDPPDLFAAVALELREIMDFDGIVIAHQQAGAEKIWFSRDGQEQRPEPGPPPGALPEDSISAWVGRHNQPVVIPLLADETRFKTWISFLRAEGLQSLCMLPLSAVHGQIGSIGVASREPHAYGGEEVRFFSLVAGQVATALDAALNFQASKAAEAELRDRNQRVQLLLDINNSLVSNLDFHALLREISISLRSLLRCNGVGVVLRECAADVLRVHALDFPDAKGLIEEGSVVEPGSPVGRVFDSGEPLTGLAGAGGAHSDLETAMGIRAYCHFPLTSRSRKLGVVSLSRPEPEPFTGDDLKLLSLAATQVAIAVENALVFREIAELKDRLAREKVYLQDEIRSELNFDEIIGRSAALKNVLRQLEIVAPTDSGVLIYGDTGTGKELIARAIHNLSSRARAAFVKLNCAAIPTGLLESELFGHERGAFTGAVAQRVGRFELADRGTVFLDEIGEIALELQPKLLRVLQEREFERLGSSRTLRTDARLIAATNRDLAAMVRDQTFRADLFYRLNVFPLYVPPLRERAEDIPLLVRHFVQHFSRRMNRAVDTIPSEAMDALSRYHWPGNIRELQNVIERAVILSSGPVLNVPLADLRPQQQQQQQQPAAASAGRVETLEAVERRHILEVLSASKWVIAGSGGAAALLGLKRSTLQARMEKLGIRRARAAE